MEALSGLQFWAQFGMAGVFAITMFYLFLNQTSEHKAQIQEVKNRHVQEVIDIYTRRDKVISDLTRMMDSVIKTMESNTESVREMSSILQQLVSQSGIEQRIEELVEKSKK